ncbi:hypothetical protein NDN08_004644 [Rhodosorus marinus]|uniref:Ribosome biogenesis protein NOP53 n=1 Tax=Rhodosorus marinus TaxID=101924 RepID=A0AAV8UM72_9RHOD|nr:hypothetical protein NDN08_004644 [Rhodosorus marinus]
MAGKNNRKKAELKRKFLAKCAKDEKESLRKKREGRLLNKEIGSELVNLVRTLEERYGAKLSVVGQLQTGVKSENADMRKEPRQKLQGVKKRTKSVKDQKRKKKMTERMAKRGKMMTD